MIKSLPIILSLFGPGDVVNVKVFCFDKKELINIVEAPSEMKNMMLMGSPSCRQADGRLTLVVKDVDKKWYKFDKDHRARILTVQDVKGSIAYALELEKSVAA